MGRMLDALKQIEGQAVEPAADQPIAAAAGEPEAELSFPDELLADTAALLDELEKNESPVQPPVEEQSPVEQPPAEEPSVAKEQSAAIISDREPRAKAWSRDSRHVDLATNILTQLPVEGPVSLLFAATASGGVFASSLVPLFSTLAERFDGRTLVVECDYRHAALARRFSVEPEFGLADVLSSLATWRTAVCQSEQAALDVLCSRAAVGGAAGIGVDQSMLDAQWSILGEKGSASWSIFETILKEMHEQYRLVLLENVSATDHEMAQLAALCHGAYLLLRSGQTPRNTARKSVKMVNNGGGQLLGCILLDP